MFCYAAYGLSIHSVLPLPELVVGDAPVDVIVRPGKLGRKPSPEDGTGVGFWATATEACHLFQDVGAFLARDGRELIVEGAPDVDEKVLRLSLLGPALALILHQRGRFVLHASAVVVNGGAVAFVGGRGWGKSALAATFYNRGYGIAADDVTAIDVTPGCPTVFPGFPQLKLWPETVISLGESPEPLPRLHPLVEKRARCVSRGFSPMPLPLRRIYVLAEGPGLEIEALPPQEGFLELVRHWYGARFGEQLLKIDGAAVLHFHQCTSLARNIPICRLKRPYPPPPLSDQARLVEHDLAHNI